MPVSLVPQTSNYILVPKASIAMQALGGFRYKELHKLHFMAGEIAEILGRDRSLACSMDLMAAYYHQRPYAFMSNSDSATLIVSQRKINTLTAIFSKATGGNLGNTERMAIAWYKKFQHFNFLSTQESIINITERMGSRSNYIEFPVSETHKLFKEG